MIQAIKQDCTECNYRLANVNGLCRECYEALANRTMRTSDDRMPRQLTGDMFKRCLVKKCG